MKRGMERSMEGSMEDSMACMADYRGYSNTDYIRSSMDGAP